MANKIKIKGGVQSSLPVLDDREPGWTTDTFRLYVGQDGESRLVGEADFLKLTGGALTGALTLNADPSQDMHAATKKYVDNHLVSGNNAIRIAVLGDSFTTVLGYGLDWPKALENLMHISGVPAEIYHVAHGGWTYRKAASTNTADLVFDGMNTLDYLIELAPDIAIVSLGFNDIFTDETDTLSQIQLNAKNVFDTIRLQLPNTFVIYATQLVYDNVNFPSGITKNKGVIPYLQSIQIGSGMADESLLNNNLYTTRQEQLDNFRALDTYVKNYINTTFSPSKHSQFNLNIWRAARLGLSSDSLHLNTLGQRYIATCAYKHFKDNLQIQSMFPTFANLGLYDYVHDPDILWDSGMTASGDGYTIRTGTNEWVWWVRAQGFNAHEIERRWFRSSLESISPEISINASTFYMADGPPYAWVVRNASPYTPVRVVLNGVDKGQIATTDASGFAFASYDAYASLSAIGAAEPGTYNIGYTVGPYSKTFEITVVGSPPSSPTPSPTFYINASTFNLAEKPPYAWTARNAPPNTPVRVAVNNIDKGQIATTDASGFAFASYDAYGALRSIGADAPGTYNITYTIGTYSRTFNVTVSNSQRKKFYSASLNTSNTSKTTWVAGGLSGSITPWNSKNKIIIRGSINCGLLKGATGATSILMDVRLKRGTTVISTWTNVLGTQIADLIISQCAFEWVDSPNSAASQTYSWEFKVNSESVDATAYFGGPGGRLCTMMLEQIEDVG